MNDRKKILIVDDSSEHRTLFSRLMARDSEISFEITEAETGQDGLRRCREDAPDCLLLDYRLPDIDGLEFLSKLGDGEATLPLPVVMLTGEGDELVAVEAMKRGAHDYLVKSHVTAEALQLAASNAMEKVEMRRDLENQRLELKRLSVTDELTGLHNRRFLVARLNEEMERAARYNLDLTLLICDLDYFKKINDRYGHLAGDQVLRNYGVLLSECARGTDIVGRYGGEEFGVVLTNTDLASAGIVAERICASTRDESRGTAGNDENFHVTCSIGMAAHSTDLQSTEDFIQLADSALYRAKSQGRDQVCAWPFESDV